MGETLSLFTTSFNRSLAVEARPERLSRDAGAVLLREILERTGIVAWLIERRADPRHPSLVTYTLADLLRTVLVLFGQGWRDQNDADARRFDPALRLAATGRRGTTPLAPEHHLASPPTLSRLRDTLSTDVNRRVLRDTLSTDVNRRVLRDTLSTDVNRRVLRDTLSTDVDRRVLRDTLSTDVNRRVLRDTLSTDVNRRVLREAVAESA